MPNRERPDYGKRRGENGQVAFLKTISLGNVLTILGGLCVAFGLVWRGATWVTTVDNRFNDQLRTLTEISQHLDWVDAKLPGAMWPRNAKPQEHAQQ